MTTRRARRGFTLAETVIATAVMLCVVMVSQSLLFASTQTTARTLRRDDSLRSVETVLEIIRSDLNRMVLVDPARDLAIHTAGQGLSFYVPARDAGDFWDVDCVPISFTVEPIGGHPGLCRLVRKTMTGTTVIGGCTLESFSVKLVPAGDIAENQTYLEITVIGAGSESGEARRFASALVPITLATAPEPYVLEGK